MDALGRENFLVLQTLQASLGLISPEISGISIQLDGERIVLYFAVRHGAAELEEDVEDIIFELDALLGGKIPLEARVYEGRPNSDWPGRQYRLIYLAKLGAGG